ncbi:MAG: archaeal proteasome endopeptidase complex subunit beta [Candidatus Methanofastidiosia archaeon]
MDFESVKKGTTTVALITKDAVVLASDRRASAGYLIVHKKAKKIHKIDDHIGITAAGAVGDIQALISLLKAEVSLYSMKHAKRMNTKSIANLTSRILYGRRMFPYIAWLVVGGYDEKPSAFSIDPIGGVSEDNFISTGSGSQVAYGVLEDSFKEDMELDDGIRLAVRCINAAEKRDLATGDGIAVAVVDEKGYRELSEKEIKEVM